MYFNDAKATTAIKKTIKRGFTIAKSYTPSYTTPRFTRKWLGAESNRRDCHLRDRAVNCWVVPTCA